MIINDTVYKIRNELIRHVDEKNRESSQRFFKEAIHPYGVRTSTVTQIGKEMYKEIQDQGKSLIFQICEELWKSGRLEESFIACHWSYYVHKRYEPEDFHIFESWIDKYVTNWASCDTLCNHTVGAFLEMYPEYIIELRRWAGSQNRWMRRAAAVSLIIPVRKGKFHDEIFHIAHILLQDPDDLVQKGYGWMLKAASQADQKAVFDFVMDRKASMTRTALRYAIEKMPQDLRKKAMERE